jgi:transcriptional regulator with XRE-family HTH domain
MSLIFICGGFVMPSLTERLRELRNSEGIAQKDIAKILGLKNDRIYRQYESGELDVPTAKLISIGDYYNVSTDYILGRTDVKTAFTTDNEASVELGTDSYGKKA